MQAVNETPNRRSTPLAGPQPSSSEPTFCRHRGMRRLEGPGNTAQGIRCPYHYWNYNLTGSLRGMRREKERFAGLDRSSRSLRPASVGVVDQMVFVHPQAQPEEPSVSWLAEAPETRTYAIDGQKAQVEIVCLGTAFN